MRSAAANGNTRVDDTPGYEQSVEYVADRLTDAGYDVEIQPFTFDAFTSRGHGRSSASAPIRGSMSRASWTTSG